MVGTIRISVALAAYNGENYIREQLDSILVQLSERDEVVISDDGSTDQTREILKQYQSQDVRIHLLDGPGRGVKKNVEHLVSHCRGQYIFLADQDDIWLPDKVEKVLGLFLQQECILVIHDARVFEGNRENITMESFFSFRQSRAGILKNIFKNSYIGCCMAFQRSLIEEIIPIPDDIEMHDQWIGIISEFKYGRSCFYREPLLLYRRHSANQSGMTHYGVAKMLQNRIVFLFRFFIRISHI